MADLLDHDRLRKLHDRAMRTGSEWDHETFRRAAVEVVPDLLAERERQRTALKRVRDRRPATPAERDDVTARYGWDTRYMADAEIIAAAALAPDAEGDDQ